MARQQGLKEFLESEVQVDTKEQLEAKQEAYENASEQDEKRLKYVYVKAKRKVLLRDTASCMMMMSVNDVMSQKLEMIEDKP